MRRERDREREKERERKSERERSEELFLLSCGVGDRDGGGAPSFGGD